MANKEDIRPIYSQLQGCLSQTPKTSAEGSLTFGILKNVNQVIDELNDVSGDSYDNFKMHSKLHPDDDPVYSVYDLDEFRFFLGGLISRLHGKYFSDENPPFSGMPSTVITQSQTQQQSQSFQIQLLLEIQSKIDDQLHNLKPSDKKRSFLEKVKEALKSVRNTTELIALLLTTGQEFGLTIEELKEVFK
jgi:hypothetical protein